MTRHYAAYNKVEEWGEYDSRGPAFAHISRRPQKHLENTKGQTLWAISGKRDGSSTVYHLCAVYEPQSVEEIDEGEFRVEGQGTAFTPHIEIGGYPWFPKLLKEQSNFSIGISEIRDLEVIAGLTRLRAGDISPVIYPDEILSDAQYPEGAPLRVTVNKYERNVDARNKCLKKYGYICRVCDFDFAATYGSIGTEYIHVHHIVDLATVGKEYNVNPITDLRPVCPNCHAMLHQTRPAMLIEELRTIVEERKNKHD